MKDTKKHIKARSKNILCSESNGSRGWLPLQVKIKTKTRFLAKRPLGLLATSQTKNIFLLDFITHSLSMQIFIKIWYTENNIVKN